MAERIGNFVLRAFQMLFAIIILGLTVTLMREHHIGSLPKTLGFAAFVAAVSVIGAIVGFASIWVSSLQGVIGLVIDAVVVIVNSIGGALVAFKLGKVTCSPSNFKERNDLWHNNMLNGGAFDGNGIYWTFWDMKHIMTHCTQGRADMVFMFLTVGVVFVALLMSFLRFRKQAS